MGVYLNSRRPYNNYKEIVCSNYFVDKSMILEELIPMVDMSSIRMINGVEKIATGNKYICLTRPRRFGKTVIANMIASYFGPGFGADA